MKIDAPDLNNLIIQGNPNIKTDIEAQRLIKRVERIQLHAHSYAFYLNFQYGSFDVFDLCAFAVKHNLQGVNLHIDAGNDKSISNFNPQQLLKLRDYLELHQLKINLEASSTTKKVISRSVDLAKSLGVKNIRVYDRYKGQLSEIIQRCIKRMSKVADVAEKHDLNFVIEPHEVLKSPELVQIIEAVNSDRVNLLFDFGNMLSTSEQPLHALEIMHSYIRQVHLKGANIAEVDDGYAQVGVRQGDDSLPHELMLYQLLMLGEQVPQVGAFSLEQQVGYYAQPYRFKNEPLDPIIPKRKPSKTGLYKNQSLEESLKQELEHANHQVIFIRKTLENLRIRAFQKLNEEKVMV